MNTECHIVSRSETWTSTGTYLYWHEVFLGAGYIEILTSWEQSNEESNPLWYPNHHCLLYGGRVRWICSFWKWCPGKPAHRIWILQSVLASWLCKRLYCCASRWRISGAHLCHNPMYGPLKLTHFTDVPWLVLLFSRLFLLWSFSSGECIEIELSKHFSRM